MKQAQLFRELTIKKQAELFNKKLEDEYAYLISCIESEIKKSGIDRWYLMIDDKGNTIYKDNWDFFKSKLETDGFAISIDNNDEIVIIW